MALLGGTNDIPEDRIKLLSDQHLIVFEGVVKKFFGNLTLVVRDISGSLYNPIQLGIGFGKLRIGFSELFIYFFRGRDRLCQECPNFFFSHFLQFLLIRILLLFYQNHCIFSS